MSMYGAPVPHRPSILHRPVRCEPSQIGAENLDVIAKKEAAMLKARRQNYMATHDRIHRSIYPSESDKQQYYEAHRMHMEQQSRARNAELAAEQARLEKYAASRPLTPTANDIYLADKPWKATTQTAYGNQQEQDQARKALAKSILDENRALALHQAALKAQAKDFDRMEAANGGHTKYSPSSFWSAPAAATHRRSPLASHNGAPYALHEAAPLDYKQMGYPVEDEGAIRSYYDRIPAAGVASSRPSSAMGRTPPSPPSTSPWATHMNLQPSERDQTSRPPTAQVSFPWSRDIVPQSSQRGRGEHNPDVCKPRPFADLNDLAQSHATTAASRAQATSLQQRQHPSFPWLA